MGGAFCGRGRRGPPMAPGTGAPESLSPPIAAGVGHPARCGTQSPSAARSRARARHNARPLRQLTQAPARRPVDSHLRWMRARPVRWDAGAHTSVVLRGGTRIKGPAGRELSRALRGPPSPEGTEGPPVDPMGGAREALPPPTAGRNSRRGKDRPSAARRAQPSCPPKTDSCRPGVWPSWRRGRTSWRARARGRAAGRRPRTASRRMPDPSSDRWRE